MSTSSTNPSSTANPTRIRPLNRARIGRLAAIGCVAGLAISGCSSGGSTAATSNAPTTTSDAAAIAAWQAKAKTHIPDDAFRRECVSVEGAAALSVVVPACSYLASIVSHDGSKILAAPNVWRLENGKNTAKSATELEQSMGNHWFRDYVSGIRDIRWYVGGDNAVAYYVLNVKKAPGIKSVLLTERFTVNDGLINQIEAVFVYCAQDAVNFADPDGSNQCTKLAGA